MIQVEIWSDVACPFCYIGKRKFEQALSRFDGKADVNIVWKSFILSPDLVTSPDKNIYQSLSESKGWSEQEARQAAQSASNMAKGVGLNYEFDRVVPANTTNAHRLLQMAKSKGKGSEMKEILLRSYFIEGKNVDDSATLTELAKGAGLTDVDVNEALTEARWLQAVEEDIYASRQIGVTGVPFFVFDNRYSVSGAQDPEMFLKALNLCLEQATDEAK
jgi:predicted DsbA family dithiol-disulfide isomerase